MPAEVAPRRSSQALKFLRIPVLVSLAMLTSGSGMGGAGCSGPDLGRECTSHCQIIGTWQLTFDDTSEFPADCLAVDARLPTEPVVISWMYEELDGDFHARVGQRTLQGQYFGGGELRLEASGNHFVTNKGQLHVYALKGRLDAVPESASLPLTWRGTYKVERGPTNPTGFEDYECEVTRSFTATRVSE
uniref:Uncharacterized protein n=1 Tax=Myxococcus fulvus TaxID=33 RepID=A0A7D5T238_MYXFU|nr:hypothetical protein [Myxococcus fulvus]